jgi:hypothetical protein
MGHVTPLPLPHPQPDSKLGSCVLPTSFPRSRFYMYKYYYIMHNYKYIIVAVIIHNYKYITISHNISAI